MKIEEKENIKCYNDPNIANNNKNTNNICLELNTNLNNIDNNLELNSNINNNNNQNFLDKKII